MMQVPTYESSVPLQAPNEPTPQVRPVGEEAAGLQTPQAMGAIGTSAEHLGAVLSRNLIHKQALDEEDKKNKALAAYHQHMVVPMKGPNGWLLREGDGAKGIVEEFQKVDEQARKDITKGLSAKATFHLNKALDSLHSQYYEALVTHHGQQEKVGRFHNAQAASKAASDAGASARTPEMLNQAIEHAQTPIMINMAQRDLVDKNLVQNTRKGIADYTFHGWLAGNLERDPVGAMKMLEAMKPKMSEAGYAKAYSMIDGKQLEARREAVWDHVKGFAHQDGTVDVMQAEQEAKKLSATLPPGQQQHILSYVKSQASVQDAALKDARQAQTRDFINQAMDMKQKGVPYETAHAELMKNKGFGFDSKDIEDKTQQLQKLYVHDDSFMAYAEAHQTEDQKNAWKWVSKVAEGQVPKKQRPEWLVTMQHKYMGQSADAIKAGVTADLKKDADVPGMIWGTNKVPGWTVDADLTKANAEKFSELMKTHPSWQIEAAKKSLERAGRKSGPDEIAQYFGLVNKK